MKYFLPLFFAALFICILTPYRAQAAVRINEVAWMGTATSQYNEWIELYNDGDSDVPLAGWTIYKTGNVLLFTLTKTITAGGYLLVERTTASAPDAVPGINDESGTFGGGGLKNTGEDLVLKDANGNPVNTLPYASGWPAGDSKTKETMQWTGSAWISAVGTPDAVNASVTSSNNGSSTTQTPAVTVTPIQPVVQNVITPATTVPASTVQSTLPDPDVIAPDQTTSSASTQPVSTPTNVVVPATTISSVTATPIKNSDTSTPVQNKKTSTSKKTIQQHSTTKSTAGTDTTANDQAAAQLQTATTEPKENNHTKIIIVAVVAFIGMALFLLLERLKASQE